MGVGCCEVESMSLRLIRVALGVILGLIVVLTVILPRGSGPGTGNSDDPVGRAILADPFPAPPLELVDVGGLPVDLQDLEGSLVALFFGYTYCPDVCPLTLATLGRLQEEQAGADPPLEVVFVSVDPERDTPGRLRSFAAGLPGRVRALTGRGEAIRAQAVAWGVDVQRPGAPEEIDPDGPVPDYRVDHTARTFILDAAGRVVATLPAMVSAADARAILERVRRARR